MNDDVLIWNGRVAKPAPAKRFAPSCDVMEVVVSEPAAELIAERGGRLYVWLTRARCCGGATRLLSSSTPPAGTQFRRADDVEGFELYVPNGLTRLPDELHVEVRRFPRRLESYWNGCAWVV